MMRARWRKMCGRSNGARRILVCVGLLAGGCSGGLSGQVSDLRRQVEELSQRQAATQRSLHDVNNRLFLLEDRVETREVGRQRKSDEPVRLPVVRIVPKRSVTPEDVPPPGGGERRMPMSRSLSGEAALAEDSVAYEGDAAAEDQPVLRLHGRGTHLSIDHRVAPPAPPRAVARERTPPPKPLPRKPPSVSPASAVMALAPEADTEADTDADTAMDVYQRALALYRSGDYDAAAAGFSTFLTNYAHHPYADNALYWQGECFYAQKRYTEALAVFRRVVETYPNEGKAPAALLKMGFCYARLKQTEEARMVLAQVVEVFPETDVARLASEALLAL